MNNENPRDGFDVWVIDPAHGIVEQVEFDPVPPPRKAVPSEARETLVAPAVAKEPARVTKVGPRKTPGASTKRKKKPVAPKALKNPGAKTKRRRGTTVKPRRAVAASRKKRANPRRRRRAKQPALMAVAARVTTAAVAKPTTRLPRPMRKNVSPPKLTAPAPAPTPAPTPTAEPAPPPPPNQPVLVASANDLARGSPINPADALMVLELACGGPAQPDADSPPRQGSIDIRFVDVHE